MNQLSIRWLLNCRILIWLLIFNLSFVDYQFFDFWFSIWFPLHVATVVAWLLTAVSLPNSMGGRSLIETPPTGTFTRGSLTQVSCQLYYAWLLSFGAPHSTCPSVLSALRLTTEFWRSTLHSTIKRLVSFTQDYFGAPYSTWPIVLWALRKTTLVFHTPLTKCLVISTQDYFGAPYSILHSTKWAHTSAVGGSPKCHPLFIWFASFKN